MILHRRARRDLTLASEPGTLAAAVSVAGNSELPRLIDGKDSELAMRAMLSDLRFGIDKVRPSSLSSALNFPPRSIVGGEANVVIALAVGYWPCPRRRRTRRLHRSTTF